ncbi:transglutaminase-like domain-containing protein [Methylobacterium oryzihabitans]|uniref:Transglutaminase family protein n=1 Tax=Methylobacterium oryzihabitans TaxID=2499852 RepID=A0A437PBP8_9HYPH|nr:transglutaminase family protein [Methylobacterium oryzihabitans]RVU19676.1 transglutaminase family protein [Methylobacterium oryzihabitans]
MQRRDVLRAGAAAAAALALPRLAAAETTFAPRPGAWRRFEVATRLALPAGGPAQAWVPLPSVAEAEWTRPLGDEWTTNARSAVVHRDPVHGAALLHLTWDAGAAPTATVTSRVETRDRAIDLTAHRPATLSDDERRLFTASTALIPTDGLVRSTAERITAGARSDRDKARAIYAWVVGNTFRKASVRGCGLGDVASMLAMGDLGGKCADINALYVGLARASGLPARDVYGIRVAPSRFGYRSLGANSETITKAQHCRAEVFLDGRGWVPVDPADVRKVALEEFPAERPLSDPKVAAARDTLFGAWETNWVAYNTAHDLRLPGSDGAPVGFLMYPEAEVAGVRLDCLDPKRFAYAITAREVQIG